VALVRDVVLLLLRSFTVRVQVPAARLLANAEAKVERFPVKAALGK
jgi:hypothetical protein